MLHGQLPDAPVTAYSCATWLAHAGEEGRLSAATLGVYKSALSTLWEEEAHPDEQAPNPTHSPAVRRVLEGIANERARVRYEREPAPRRPPAMLSTIAAYGYSQSLRRDVMLRAAAMTGVCATLRCKELLGSPRYPERALRCSQVCFYADEMCTLLLSPVLHHTATPVAYEVKLRITKTTQLRGVTKVVSTPIAVAALWRWCRHRRATKPSDLLFYCNGRRLTMASLVGDLNRRHRATKSLPPLVRPYTGKCLRDGGTSTLAAAGAESADIAALGWAPNSQMWRRYADHPGVQHARRIVMSRQMQLPSSPGPGDSKPLSRSA